jgi:hypothetical protein
VLLTADERLAEDRFQWMRTLLDVGDPEGEVAATWIGKELLRAVYAAKDEDHARRRLIAFYLHCADEDIPELSRLARTVSRWAEQILAYHRTGSASNGRVENTHMLIEKIRRNSHGFSNHRNYRRRIIGRLGRCQLAYSRHRTNTRPPTTIHRVAPDCPSLHLSLKGRDDMGWRPLTPWGRFRV